MNVPFLSLPLIEQHITCRTKAIVMDCVNAFK